MMPLLDEHASGAFVIAVTPFREEGALDLDGAGRLVEFYLERRVAGITLLGQMGEAAELSSDEALAFVRRVIACVNGRVPVLVGVSAPGLEPMKRLARAVMDAGAAGVMVAATAGLRSDDQILAYFQSVARALDDIPFALQDYPLATGVYISPSALRRVVETIPACVMLKHEDWPGLSKISQLRAGDRDQGLRRVSILVGNGGLFLPEELGRGADGAMTGFSFPEMMVGVCDAWSKGDRDRACDLFDAYLPLIRYEHQQGLGLAVRKYVLARRGAIASPAMRRPGRLSANDVAEVDRLIERQARRLEELG